MQYEIITFGNGEILKGVFDAISICLNAKDGTLYTPLIRISMIIGGLWAALYAIYGDYLRAINGWIIPMTVIMQLLLVPQATVWINDPVSRYHQKVDHIPYGLAMVAGNISKIGYAITKQIEQVFILPDDLKYQKTGAVFASQLLQQAKTFRVTNEELAENMRHFVEQCIVYDALIGRKYNIEDLRHSADLWGLVSSNPSPIRSFAWRNVRQGKEFAASPEIITCKQGVLRFNREWRTEINQAATIFGKKIFGKGNLIDPKAELLKYLPLAYAALTDLAQSAQDLLKQQMMIYAVVDSVEQKSTSLGNAPNFALRRAYLQQRTNYETLGAMAASMLPAMKGTLEAITYAAFLFIIPLSILPFGWSFIKNWIQVLVWLQTWAPLYAILNYIMTLAARAKSIAALSISNEAGVTIASSVGLANVNADLAAMTGYLALSIPFLCIAIVKGVSSLVSVPAILTGVSQSVASTAAGEAVAGNYSFGNISEGTRQIANTSMLNQNYAAYYKSGSFQQADGRSDLITNADGQQIVNIASSNVPISLNVAETKSAQLSQQASKSYQKALQQSEAFTQSMADTLRHGVELSDHLASSKNFSDSFNDGKTIEQTTALNKTAQFVKDFAKDHNLTTMQSSQILAAAGIGGEKGLSMLSKNLPFLKSMPALKAMSALSAIDLNVKGEMMGNANVQDVYRKAEKIAQNEDFQHALRQASYLSHNQTFTQHNDEGKRLADNMAQSWDEANNFRNEASKSFSEAQSYQQQALAVTSSAASINANYTQEFVDWLSNQKADNTGGHIGRQGAAYIIANQPNLRQSYAQQFLANKQLDPFFHEDLQISSPYNLKYSYIKEHRHAVAEVNKDITKHKMDMMKRQAMDGGLNEVNDHGLKNNFDDTQSKVQQELHTGQQQINQEYTHKESSHNKQARKNLTSQAIKQELSQGAHVMLDPLIAAKDLVVGESQTK